MGSEADEASAKKAALLERMSKMGRGVMGDEAQDPNMQQQGFGQPGQPNMQNPMGNQMGMNPQMGQFQQQGQFQNQNGFPNQQPMFNQFGQQIMPQNRPQNQLALMPQMQQQQQNQQQMFDQFGNPIPSPQQQQQQQQTIYDQFGNIVQQAPVFLFSYYIKLTYKSLMFLFIFADAATTL